MSSSAWAWAIRPAPSSGCSASPAGRRVRAELLDEGLEVLAGLQTGQPFSHQGRHFTVGPVRFSPSPVQRPRVPVWVGGVLPANGVLARAARWAAGVRPRTGPVARAARWDGFVPIHPGRPADRPTVAEIAAARDTIAGLRGTTADFDIAVWGELDSCRAGSRPAARLPRCGGHLVAGEPRLPARLARRGARAAPARTPGSAPSTLSTPVHGRPPPLVP